MSFHSLLAISLLALLNAPTATALEPLTSKKFTWPNIPFQVTGDQGGGRGPQAGYNLCNSTTEGPNSMCQTLILNDLSDFCMWSSGQPHDTVGESEAREVAWCTKSGHGSRLIPPGTITGAQWLYSKNYVAVVGFLDQTKLNLDPTDAGGELDPHGDDEQGNPLGGIVFTNGFGKNAASFAQQVSSKSSEGQNLTQVVEWVDFIGSGVFCLKMCNPNDPNGASLCNHIYDEIGCDYNVVANYDKINGTFSVCDSDDMDPPGVFTTAPGQTTTWFQGNPAGAPPYTPTIPASSNCQTFASTQLFAAAATASPTASPTTSSTGAAKSPGASGGKVAGTSLAAGTRSGSGANPSATGQDNGTLSIRVPVTVLVAAVFGAALTFMA